MSKFSNLTKEELLALAEKQEAELASKKYGLVWDAEREPEQVVLDCEHHLPVLKRVKGKEIKTALEQGDNILIEGDNYHALTTLNYTHQGKIDVIYIDPPYNTGNQDFKYNDKFVDKEDGFRHSKWLNFMEKRLRLSKDLMNENGVIFISIDDNEQAHLRLLCHQIFGEENFRNTIIVRRRVKSLNSQFADNGLKSLNVGFEYVLCYARNSTFLMEPIYVEKEKISENGRWDVFWSGADRPTMRYDVLGFIPKTGQWRYSKQKAEEAIKNYEEYQKTFSLEMSLEEYWRYTGESKKFIRRIENGVGKNGGVQHWVPPRSSMLRNSNWLDLEVSEIRKEFDFNFNNPKNPRLMEEIIKLSGNKTAIILDFFAGSGTTGHAVMNLNKEDGGNRQFILCTNNENNICEEVTYPRIQKVIKGYKKNEDGEKVEGLGGNLQYFKTDLIKKTKNKDQMRVDLTQKCTDMLGVKENIFNLESEHEDYKIFSSNQKDQFLCVYYNFYDESFDEFLKEVKKLKGHKKIYMFSMDGKVDKKLFKEIKDFDVEEIPQKIIDIYKQLVKMNIPVKAETIFFDLEKAKQRIFEDKEKDEGARVLRIVLEKTLQKIAQKNAVAILDEKGKEQKIALVNDKLKDGKILTKVFWEENKTYLAIGNHASHGEYEEYDLKQVERFYKHVQELHNNFGI